MRVLQVIDSLATGGAERLLVDLCPMWRAHGIDVDIYVLRACGSVFEAELRQSGVTIFEGGRGSVYSPLHVAKLAFHLHRRHYDVVHVHLYPAQLWMAMVSRCFPDCRVITTEHNTSNRRRSLALGRIDSWMYSQFDLVTCISKGVLDALIHWIGRAHV